MTVSELSIRSDRVMRNLDRLAEFSDAPPPAVTRVLFTPTDMQGREFVRQLMEQAGLTTSQDAAGNLFGRCGMHHLLLAAKFSSGCLTMGSNLNPRDISGSARTT